MSQLKVNTIRHTGASSDAVTLASDGTCTASLTAIGGAQLSNRNKVINGGMIISQRHGTSSVALSSTEQYTVDRYKNDIGGGYACDWTASQSTDAPVGFKNSLKIENDSAVTPGTNENGGMTTFLEGQDLQDFAFGTASAKPMTVSFYAKAGGSAAGTYCLKVSYLDSSGNRKAQTRGFTITTSWQRFSFTLAANGTSTSTGIRNTNGQGLQLYWHLTCGTGDQIGEVTTWGGGTGGLDGLTGQSNFSADASNEFYLTGVQVEVGDVLTSFEHRSYGDELQRCMRYYYQETYTANYHLIRYSFVCSSSQQAVNFDLPVSMRTDPTVTNNGVGNFRVNTYGVGGSSDETCNGITTAQNGINRVILKFSKPTSNMEGSRAGVISTEANNDAALYFSAEL